MVGGLGRTMLSGFNTNFRYRGVLFHVQTEDSGHGNPHVITHLFHGGNIMASHKQDYSSLLGADDIEDGVRKLMEGQHKAMLKQLSRGEHDDVIAQRLGQDIFRVEGRAPSDPPTVTEEELPPDVTTPPLVIAEPTSIGAEDALRDSFGPESILQPEFANKTSPSPTSPEPGAEEEEPAPRRAASQLSRVFGDRVVSEKPLDEVVMDYLVDNARKRKRQPK